MQNYNSKLKSFGSLKNYKAIFFDFDGTLAYPKIDWDGLKIELNKKCKEELNIDIKFTPIIANIRKIREEHGEEIYDKLLKIIEEFELADKNFKINQELVNYINDKSGGQKIAIYSMSAKKLIDFFVEKYLTKKPEIVVSKENCIQPKPTDKDIVKLLNLWDIEKSEAVFVGNSENDRLSGEMAGVKTIIVSQNSKGKSQKLK